MVERQTNLCRDGNPFISAWEQIDSAPESAGGDEVCGAGRGLFVHTNRRKYPQPNLDFHLSYDQIPGIHTVTIVYWRHNKDSDASGHCVFSQELAWDWQAMVQTLVGARRYNVTYGREASGPLLPSIKCRSLGETSVDFGVVVHNVVHVSRITDTYYDLGLICRNANQHLWFNYWSSHPT
jgi:hypothetical protein